MKKITLLIFILFSVLNHAQVGVNTNTPDSSSALDIESTTGGILIPRLTETQRDNISLPATGLMIYQIDQTTGFYFYNGAAWTRLEGVEGPQGIQGPAGNDGVDGQDGVGITSTVDNNNGTFTINYTDGSSFTTSDLTGPQGIQGPAGNDGVDGQDGVGITSTVDNNNGTFTINYTDGSSFTTADLTGPEGAQGIQGEQGPIGPTGLTGPQGIQGPAGNDGVDGQDGVGITSTVDNNNGTFTINYTDGSSFTTADLTGPQGAQGIQGEQGPIGPTGLTGPQGIQGPAGNDGVDGMNGTDGTDGASAYEIWLSLSNTGTEQDFIDSLTGTNGKNTLIKTNDEPSGNNCVNGGVKIEVGLDINTNGVLDNDEIDGSLTQYICNLETATNNSSVPVGTIISYAGNIVPSGWLVCDGSEISRGTYSDLFIAMGVSWGEGDGSTTFNLPDLRGRFLRGVDEGAGNDPDRSSRTALNTGGNTGDNVGSYQNDQFKSHNHGITTGGSFGNQVLRKDGSSSTSTSTNNAGGTETRPKNAYVYFIIKTN
jgi:microcystin-dependent protein